MDEVILDLVSWNPVEYPATDPARAWVPVKLTGSVRMSGKKKKSVFGYEMIPGPEPATGNISIFRNICFLKTAIDMRAQESKSIRS